MSDHHGGLPSEGVTPARRSIFPAGLTLLTILLRAERLVRPNTLLALGLIAALGVLDDLDELGLDELIREPGLQADPLYQLGDALSGVDISPADLSEGFGELRSNDVPVLEQLSFDMLLLLGFH